MPKNVDPQLGLAPFAVKCKARPRDLRYFFGIIFDEGYYRFFHLDSTLFPNSIHETIVRGVLGIVQIAATKFAFIILVPLGALLLILLLNRPLIWLENKLIKSSSAKTSSDKINQLHGLHTVLASLVMASLFYVLAALLIAALAWSVSIAGKGVAKREFDKFNLPETTSKTTFKSLTLVLKQAPETPLAAEIIRCNSIRCAFYIDESVHVINTDQIKIIKTHQ